jgi:hypothetical protein
LLGHKTLPGRISEETRFGGTLGRVDVPGEGETWETTYFATGSIYSVRITTEEEARETARRMRPRPVHASALPPCGYEDGSDDSEDDDDNLR